jgi:TorA maturation chaperone TorD
MASLRVMRDAKARRMKTNAGLEGTIGVAEGFGALPAMRHPAQTSFHEIMNPDFDTDEVDRARAWQYALLAALLVRAPNAQTLAQLTRLQGTPTPLGLTHIALAEAAGGVSEAEARSEFFNLFIGVGRGELMPYASYYLTGFLQDLPLARLRSDLARLGLARAEKHYDPEDHIGTLCEIMSGLADGSLGLPADEAKPFFARHLAPWAMRFFTDLEMSKAGKLYRAVGAVGRTFMEIEAEAFALDD